VATAALEKALLTRQLPYQVDPGEGVFYGPKIDIKIKDSLDRAWQCSTIQVDFHNPNRFGLEFIGEDGKAHQPVMVHRALLGSLERFFGVLVEHYAGAFPAWLAPVQVIGIPVADVHVDYLQDVAARLRTEGIRVEVDTADDRFPKKIRNAQKAKVPFMLIAGDDDVSKGAVSFRYRDGSQNNGVSIDDAVTEIVTAVRERTRTA
jgi:threonyl-tRNA synthetase